LEVPYFKPWINSNDKKKVLSVLNNRWLTNGPNLIEFENTFRKVIRTKYSIGTGSATHALHLTLRALGINQGDEVIVPTFTFAATANSVLYCGAKPIFTDIESDTFNISVKDIEKKITKKTKAIILVHYGGQSCDMDKILKIAKKNSLLLVEDCAHALGSKYLNKFCGSFGHAGCFSFYPTKIITTGEGGMITTNNSDLNQKTKLLRSHAMSVTPQDREKNSSWQYDIVDLGYNYRLDEIRSALGISQLKRVNEINKKRISIAKKYDKLISKIKGLTIPAKKSDRNHIYHLYTIKVESDYHLTRNELFEFLSKNGIGSSVQYYPLHLMSFYKNKFKIRDDFPVANEIKDQVISLPIYPQMTEKEFNYVISKLK